MASNKELIKQINHHANNLGMDRLELDGFNNAKLAELLSDLKAKWRDATTHTVADGVKVDNSCNGIMVISEGKSLTTKRGILGPGDGIVPGDLAGGEEALEYFVSTGHVLKA